MKRIKNILFDLGGVIMTIDQSQAVERFQEIGVADAAERLDPYTQGGIFGDLERGAIDAETFRCELGKIVGHSLTLEQCEYAWRGYCREVPQRNLDALVRLRQEGYRLVLLSNTNPFMMNWAMSDQFDGHGHPLSYYMDACYMSYKCKVMKPDEMFFRKVMQTEGLVSDETLFVDDGPRNVAAASELGIRTFCPKNGEDWTLEIEDYLNAE